MARPPPNAKSAKRAARQDWGDFRWKGAEDDLEREIQQVRAHLVSIGARIRHDNDKVARRFGVSGPDMRILFALNRAKAPPQVRPTDLFESLLIPSATMTRQIERLVQLGFIERSYSPDDRRVHMVSLTPKGARAAAEAMSVGIETSGVTSALKARLSHRDLSRLKAMLQDLKETLDAQVVSTRRRRAPRRDAD